jgi:hypothetical protein
MLRRNLTLKVLGAVGLTVAVIIGLYTYFVIRVQTAWWHERTQAQALINAALIHEYLNGVMMSDRHEEVQGFLQELKKQEEILRCRLIKPDGTVVFSTETQEVQRATLDVPAALFSERRVLQGIRNEPNQRVAVVLRPVTSTANCRRCHGDTEVIGAIEVERSLAPAEAALAGNRNLMIGYGAAIFLLVGVVLWLLISRLVTQPVAALLQLMRRVQSGDLRARAAVETVDEVGELSRGFNAMVRSLARATRELRQAHEKQVQQASKLASIGELASGIAHEVRNPLAGIGAAVEVLAETGNGTGATTEIVGEIRQQIARLNRTTRDLLEFARLRDPEITACDLHEIVRPMIGLVRPDAQKFRVQIVEAFDLRVPQIRADAQQLQQAVLNILINGVQAMPAGGTLTVKTEVVEPADDAPQVRLIIRDTGMGIAAENVTRIFSPFFTTKHRGTGLGLAITRSIIERHGGTIAVESRAGEGTTFTLQLAAVIPAPAQEEYDHAPTEIAHH